MCNFTHSVLFHTHRVILHTRLLYAVFFVARQLLSQIDVLSSVKFPGLKLRLCKKNDKYQVCQLGWLCLKSDLLLGEIRQVTELEMISELLAEVKNSGEVEEQAKSFSGFHPHLVSEQANRKPPTYKPPIWEITKSHRKFWTNWNVENLKPSVVVASCGVSWGQNSTAHRKWA